MNRNIYFEDWQAMTEWENSVMARNERIIAAQMEKWIERGLD